MAITAGNATMTNYARLGHAAQHELPNLLKELLAIKTPATTLHGRVRSNQYLLRNLRPHEWILINNAAKDGYDNSDVGLMYKLFRNFNLVPSPTNGWDFPRDPSPVEINAGDDVERIRRLRNDILHRGNTNVIDAELANYFTVFKDIARRFEALVGKPNKTFVSQFEFLETCCMDQEIEETYVNNLKELQKQEHNLDEKISEIQNMSKAWLA